MPKICNEEGCENNVWGKGYCKWHQHRRTDKKVGFKKSKAIQPISKKRLEELATYRPLRDKYLRENTECEVRECTNKSTHIHHKNGRIGAILYYVPYFMAVCNECHPEKIHENPAWARENGYLI